MSLDELTLPKLLMCIGIEQWVDGIKINWRMRAVVLHLQKRTVIVPGVPIHAPGRERISTWAAASRDEMPGAGYVRA